MRLVRLTAGAVLVAATFAYAQTPSPTFSVREEDDATGGHIVVQGPVDYTYDSPDPRTVVLEFAGWDASRLAGPFPVRSVLLDSVEIGGGQKGSDLPFARVTVHLAGDLEQHVFVKDGAVHLVVSPADLTPSPSPVSRRAARPTAAPTATRTPKARPRAPTPRPTPEPVAAATPPPPASAIAPPSSAPAVAAPRSAERRLRSVHGETGPQGFALIIEVQGAIAHHESRVPNPERLVVDLEGLVLPHGFVAAGVEGGPVLRVRVAQFSASPKVVRIVADLKTRAPYTVAVEGERLIVTFAEAAPKP